MLVMKKSTMTLVPFNVYPNAGREFGVTVLDACDTGARPTAFNALRRFVPRVPVLKATVGFVDVRSPCTDFGLNWPHFEVRLDIESPAHDFILCSTYHASRTPYRTWHVPDTSESELIDSQPIIDWGQGRNRARRPLGLFSSNPQSSLEVVLATTKQHTDNRVANLAK